jgi:hypothetical protein
MDLIAERVEVWAASIEDKPGSLANILAGLRETGANLNFILARREPDQPGQSVVYVTPLTGDAELEAAATLGFNLTARVHSVRVEGPNQPGIAAALAAQTRGGGPQPARVLGGGARDPIHPVYRAGFRRGRREGVDRPATGLNRTAWGIRKPAPVLPGPRASCSIHGVLGAAAPRCPGERGHARHLAAPRPATG